MNYLIGHLIGDYLLQNDWMAMNKKKSNFHCFVHCFLYTVAVMICTGWFWFYSIPVFLSHWIFDRTTLVVRYMDLIGAWKRIDRKSEMFTFAYLIIDNTFHLVCLFIINLFA